MEQQVKKAYDLGQNIEHLSESLAEAKRALASNLIAQKFLTATTFLIYIAFAAAMYAGVSLWGLQNYISQNAANIIGLLFTLALIVVMPIGLALTKHLNYRALAKSSTMGAIGHSIIALAVFSGVYYESISATSNQHEKALMATEQSGIVQKLQGSVTAGNDNTGIALLVADADKKYQQCLTRLNQGKEKHCNGDKAKLDSLKNQGKEDRAAQATAQANAPIAMQQAIDKERESHIIPVGQMFAEWFTTKAIVGLVYATIVASIIFELVHLTSIFNERKLTGEINYLKMALSQTNGEYMNATGKMYSEGDFSDGSVLEMETLRENGVVKSVIDPPTPSPTPKTKPDGDYQTSRIGFGAPISTTAKMQPIEPKQDFFRYQERMRSGDFMPPTSTLRQELANGKVIFSDQPLDKPVLRDADMKQNARQKERQERMLAQQQAKIGDMFPCEHCGTPTRKTRIEKRFCSDKCRMVSGNYDLRKRKKT